MQFFANFDAIFIQVTLIFDKTGRDRTHSTSSIISSSSSYHEQPIVRTSAEKPSNRMALFLKKKKNERRLRSESLLSRESSAI